MNEHSTGPPPPPATSWQAYSDWLKDSESPLDYRTWLRRSGTINRLSEVSTLFGTGSHSISSELERWWTEINVACTWVIVNPSQAYLKLCEAFGVPPLLCQVDFGEPLTCGGQGLEHIPHGWYYASSDLMFEILAAATKYPPDVFAEGWENSLFREGFANQFAGGTCYDCGRRVLKSSGCDCGCYLVSTGLVRSHHPWASGFSLRLLPTRITQDTRL